MTTQITKTTETVNQSSIKTTLSGWVAASFGLLTIVATVPTELQAQIMSLMPKTWQPYTALIFAVAAFLARAYQANATADKAKVVVVKEQVVTPAIPAQVEIVNTEQNPAQVQEVKKDG